MAMAYKMVKPSFPGDGGDEREGGVPALVHGDEVEEGAPLRGLQDRRAVARRAGGQGGRPRGGLRGARRRAALRRLPLRRLRLRLRHRRQLPEEQDLLHRLVTDGVEDQGQDPVRDVEARPAAAAGRGPLRGAGHRPLRDGLRRHQRPRAMRPASYVLCMGVLLSCHYYSLLRVYLIDRPDTNWRLCAPVASMMPSDEGSCVLSRGLVCLLFDLWCADVIWME